MKIVDKSKTEGAQWFVHTGLYRFAHPTREGVFFDPQEPTLIVADDWIKVQTLIVPCPDPSSGEPIPGPVQPGSVLRDGDTGEPVQSDSAAKAAQAANEKLNGDAKKK